MKPYILFLSIVLLLGLASCGSEDDITPVADTNTDCFEVDPNATDAESVLRRNFKNEEYSYLLFNDTLRREYLGKDFNGDDRYFTETIDFDYNIGGTQKNTSEFDYTFTYITEQSEKEQAVAFLKTYVLSHLPKSLRPFSWLLVKQIIKPNSYSGDTYYDALSGQRCIAIAVDNLTEDTYKSGAIAALTTTLSKVLESKETELQAFYAICEDKYGGTFSTDDNPDYDDDINLEHCKEAGFIIPYYFWGTFSLCGYYPKKEDDMSSFTDLIMKNSMEEIQEMYGSYPLVMEKAQLLHDIFESIGYIF